MYKLSSLDKASIILVLIGAILWGIYGFLGINLVGSIFKSSIPLLERIIYCLVGLAGVNLILSVFTAQNN